MTIILFLVKWVAGGETMLVGPATPMAYPATFVCQDLTIILFLVKWVAGGETVLRPLGILRCPLDAIIFYPYNLSTFKRDIAMGYNTTVVILIESDRYKGKIGRRR